MDLSDLDYSDAGDSGWTMYLNHSSSISQHHFSDHYGETKQEHDEDSSMVSDASSGPPYYCEEAVPENLLQQNKQYWCKSKFKNKNKKKVHKEQRYSERFSSSLDDTASSLPVGEGVLAHNQPLNQFPRFDDFSRSYTTRRINKEKYNSGFSVDNINLGNRGGSNQK